MADQPRDGGSDDPAKADRSSTIGDQPSADTHQSASDRDQAATDRDIRRRAARQREHAAQARLDAAERRDAIANARDRAALARDEAADARDLAMAELAAASDMRAAEQHKRAAQYLAQAVEERALAVKDRQAAARDREEAARERLRALVDREALARQVAIAAIDPLTGARTRAAGLTDLDHELDRCRRTGGLLVVAYVDVVGLKIVNDSEGHGAGDELLKRVGQLIRKHLRPYDLIIRLGGDEFLCAMSNMTLPNARQRFSTIAAALAAAPGQRAIRTGFAELAPDQTATELIAHADDQMRLIGTRRPATDKRPHPADDTNVNRPR